ncbi:PD-(D/E)XK nuclease family protein [bacterium]|nr:PD-(D/E)XK nuclease family protein [bacterium]
MTKNKKIWLSHHGLELLERCPRCFWLQYNRGIYQPEGIVSRLANRFDTIIKRYFNLYRPLGELPPMIKGKVEGKLENPFQEAYFYHYNDDYGFWGKLDECLVNTKGEYTPVDFKTSSSDPREKETLAAYQNQMDAYAWLLEENNKKTSGFGYLIYFYPDYTKKLDQGVKMIIYVKKIKTNPLAARSRFLQALKILKGPIPKPAENCPFCSWYDKVSNELNNKNNGKLF